MEKPFYGRTGLLDSGRDGVPVQKPRLLPVKVGSGAAATVVVPTLKWSPTLLTAPQRLLNHFAAGRPVDGTLVNVLRLGSMSSLLQRTLALDRGQAAILTQQLLRWHQSNSSSSRADGDVAAGMVTPPRLTWYLPDYRVIIVKDGSSIGALGDVSQRAVTLLGKDRAVSDVALDHPSCSSQHAALEAGFQLSPPAEADLLRELATELCKRGVGTAAGVAPPVPPSLALSLLCDNEAELGTLFHWLWARLVAMQREEYEAAGGSGSGGDVDADGEGEPQEGEGGRAGSGAGLPRYVHGASTFWSLELLLTDLGSTNGTRVNGTPLAAFTPSVLIEGDVITFGASSRQYVVMRSSIARS